MRRLTLVLLVAAAALVAAGFAIAHGRGVNEATAVSAGFTASVDSVRTRTTTCRSAGGSTFQITKGEYDGRATSTDSDLAGDLTIRAVTVLDTTKNIGWIDGKLRIEQEGSDTKAGFEGVYADGRVTALLAGKVRDPSAHLLGVLSAAFDPKTGFTAGAIGSGSAPSSALEIRRGGGCEPVERTREHPEKVEVAGAITAVSSTSITVAGVTCAIPERRGEDIVELELSVGDRVRIVCKRSGESLRLEKIRRA